MKKEIEKLGVKGTLKLMRNSPEKALPRLMDIMDAVSQGEMPAQRAALRRAIEDEECNWHRMLMRVLTEIDPSILDALIVNFALNASMEGWQRQIEARERYGCNVPWAILLDPTSACNLRCKGCWAADYGNKLNLSYDDIDSIIEQGKELGVYFYIYTGGEPLVRKADIVKLCEKHDDCVFLAFTNGTLIDEAFCDDMLRVKNFIPAVSVEGDRESTDARRGAGVYDRAVRGMDLMRERMIPFGISCCYTSANFKQVSSPEYLDWLIDQGAMFIWYFHYMPVGSDADVSLMVSPEQRMDMYYRVREFRETKDLFAMDFQNDGEFVQGCIAGGRRYLHINANGDVDPCVFVHFSDSNIHEKTLLECLQSPLFMAYHDGQPFNDNMLRPCPMLENPQLLREIIARTGAHSTNLEGAETVEELCGRCDAYAEHWKPAADYLWEKHPHVVDFVR
ncbi:MAG: radical SAM protein [Eggerthellaceae bacterium]|nr:radical SAM protein [Eggerthellaceae bacterium]